LSSVFGLGPRRVVLGAAWIVGLCAVVLAGFVTGDLALAQEPVHMVGEVTGGERDSMPIELEVGEMVQGRIVARTEALALGVDGPDGKQVQWFGQTLHGTFYYAAETDGRHVLWVAHPGGPADLRAYDIEYSIEPTDLAPGAGSGSAPIDVWSRLRLAAIIIGVIVAAPFVLMALMSARSSAGDVSRQSGDDEGSWELPEEFWVLPMSREGITGMSTGEFASEVGVETSYALRRLKTWQRHKIVTSRPYAGTYRWWRRLD